MNNESDRKAYYKDKAIKAEAESLAKYLSEHPEVGVLNNGKLYKIVNNEVVYVIRPNW